MAENEYEIPGYSSRMSTQLYKLQQDGYMCDAVIATNSGIINVHKLVLMASCSPLLMESVRKTEKTGGSICMIEIPAEIEDVKRFVQALYTGKIFLDQDCIDRIIGIGQILKMEEETKFLEKIKAEFQNSSEKDFPQEINVKEGNETGTITLQVDGETITVQTEDSIKDDTLQKEVGLTAESELSLVELPSYGSENDIEMHIPGFEYKNEESGMGIKRERCDDSSHEEPGDGAMIESKRQRVSDDTAVTNVKQEPDGSPPDTESVNQNEKESIVSTQLEGSTCEPSENILTANIIDLTNSPGGSMDEPLKLDILKIDSKEGDSPSVLNNEILHVSDSDIIDLPKEQNVELVQQPEVKQENSGSEGIISDENCFIPNENVVPASVEIPDPPQEVIDEKEITNAEKQEVVEEKEISNAEKQDEPLPEFDGDLSKDSVIVCDEKEEAEKVEESAVVMSDMSVNVQNNVVDACSSVENSIVNLESNPVENVLNVKSNVDTASDTESSPDVIIVSSSFADNSFSADKPDQSSVDLKKEPEFEVSDNSNIKSQITGNENAAQISRQISGIEEISDENCQSMSDISNDELPDSPMKGIEAKKPVEYENVSEYESVSDDSGNWKGILYENVSDGSSPSVVLIDYDTVSDEGSIDKDLMEYEVISECSSLEKIPIEYEVVSGDEEEVRSKAQETESSIKEDIEITDGDKFSVSSSKKTNPTVEGSEQVKDDIDDGSEISMETLDEEHYDSDDDVAIIRCYKCTANFIDKEVYYEHMEEHERDEFDAYKYRVESNEDDFDAYNYQMEPPRVDEKQLYQELLRCEECDENFLSKVAFEDHRTYHKRQKMLEKLNKIEKALDKDEVDLDMSSISSFGSDTEPPISKQYKQPAELEQHRRSASRERSITLDFFSSPPRDHRRSHERSRSPVSPPSYTVRGGRHYRRHKSSSPDTLESIGSLSDERDFYEREYSRERRSLSGDRRSLSRERRSFSRERSLSRDSFSDFDDHHHHERSHSYDSFSSSFTSDSSHGIARKEMEMNLDTALEEMVSGIKDASSRKGGSKKKKRSSEKKSNKAKQSLDTFDWLASLQNPSEAKMEKSKVPLKANAPVVPPSSLYGSYSVGHPSNPIASSVFQGLQPQHAAGSLSQTLTSPVWPNKPSYPTVASNPIPQGQALTNSFVAPNLRSTNPAVPYVTPVTTASTTVPLKGILKNTVKSQPSTTTIASATILSSRQLVSIPIVGPQFVPSKVPSTSSSITQGQQKSTQAEVLSTLGPVFIPKPTKPTKWPANLSALNETPDETESSEHLGESSNPNVMFFELTQEEEEQKRTEIRKARMQLLQKLKHAKGEEKVQLQKEVHRSKLLVHKLYHKLMKCPTCTFYTRDPREYNRHQRVRCHNLLVCHHCDLTFATQEGLQEHLGTHKKVCAICGVNFFNDEIYNEHLVKHKQNSSEKK